MLPSIIRTVVPVIVGVLLGQAARLGLDLPAGAVTEIVTVAVTAAYYAIVRAIEQRVPAVGVLLGYPRAPKYRKDDVDLAA